MKKIALFSIALLLNSYLTGVYAFTTDLVGSTSWYSLLKGANFDHYTDTQASKAGTEIIGNSTHPSFYINYDDNGTTTGTDPELDDILSLRIRIGDETKTTHSAYAFFGVDADNDGVLDVFFSSGSGNTAVWDAGGDLNVSPSTTSIANTPAYSYVQSAVNYNFAQVSAANDPDWSGDNDLNADSNIDVFISFSIPVVDLDALLATLGISFTQDTQLRFVSLTATQTNSLNSDFNGVDRSSVDDWTQTYAALGIISDPVNSGGVIDTTPPAAPTVDSQTSHSSTPTITGTYPSGDADGGLTVEVNSVTYTLDVDFSATGDNWSLVIPPANALLDNTYNVVATVTDGAANSSTDTTSNELIVDATASTATSTITAAQTSITADGSSTSTITVQLKFANGDNLSTNGGTVALSTSLGALTGVTANGNGTYTATLTSATTAGSAAITGTLDGNAIADTANVAFAAGPASTATSTITAAPASISANSVSTATITVTLKDANGNNLNANGGVVALSTNLGSLGGVTANGNGTYSATLTSSIIAGIATVSGTLDGNAITDSEDVTFVPGAASTATSTVTAAPAAVTADGSSTSTITVQLKDANGNNLSANGGTVALSTNLGALSGVTANGNGTYTATLTSATTAGSATITGTLDGNAITDNASVAFTPGPASTATTTLAVSPATITADGVSTSSITVQLKDANGNNLSANGGTVVLSTNLGSISTVNPNGDGTYTATLTSATTAGTAAISGTLDGAAIVDTVGVDFVLLLDTDNDGIADAADLDDDNDGIPDSLEGDGLVDSDNDLVVDSLDLDSDNDGLFDIDESGADNPRSLDLDNDGRIDSSNSVGANGLADAVESSADSGTIGYNSSAILDSDNDTVADFRDLDSDNDGIPDVTETGAGDADNDGVLGTGVPVVDADGLAGGAGLTAADTDADNLPDQRDLDADNDGVFDIVEAGGVDSINDGIVDGFVDNDGNGYDDGLSVTPLPVPDTDFDSIPDFQDNDDTDNDGIPDTLDLDDDNDGITDSMEGDGLVDSDADGIPDSLDLDSDNDGLSDLSESGAPDTAMYDADSDGRIDPGYAVGSNGIADVIETSADSAIVNYSNGAAIDTDGDGTADFRDLDSDNDSVPDVIESGGEDPDGDGLPGSGAPAVNNAGLPAGGDLSPIDSDGDGQPNQRDLDSDGDGIFDLVETRGQDTDQNGMVDNFIDNDDDGFDDAMEALPLAIIDSDADGIPDLMDADVAGGAVIHTGVDGIGQLSPWLLMLLAPLVLLLRRLSPRLVMTGIALCCLTAQANANDDGERDNGFWQRIYIGAGLGYSLMAPETGGTIYSIKDDTDTAGKLYVGFDLSDSISAELSYNDLGTTTLNPNGEIDYRVTALYGLYYLYDHGEDDHVGPALYLKAGLGSISNSANVPYQKDNSVQLSFGVGVEYGWENGLAVRAVAESFDDDAALFTAGVLYRFGKRPKSVKQSVVPVVVIDTDQDGVVDSSDRCPETPAGTGVDSTGCEPDSDKDGVADSRDQCPATVAGAAVNDDGCALFETTLTGVNFEVNSADLMPEAKQVLDTVAESLVAFSSVRIEVQAHTDSLGRKDDNQVLSDARALSVVAYLVEKGVDRDRLMPRGFGEDQPVASNDTAEGRAKNRRVVFSVVP